MLPRTRPFDVLAGFNVIYGDFALYLTFAAGRGKYWHRKRTEKDQYREKGLPNSLQCWDHGRAGAGATDGRTKSVLIENV